MGAKLSVRIFQYIREKMVFPGGSVVKNLPANAGDAGDASLIPGLGRSPGVGNGNPIQYSCLGEPMDRGAQRATIHGVARVGHDLATKQHQLKDLCAHMCSVMSDSLWPHGL